MDQPRTVRKPARTGGQKWSTLRSLTDAIGAEVEVFRVILADTRRRKQADDNHPDHAAIDRLVFAAINANCKHEKFE
jgi:hypothetical protein